MPASARPQGLPGSAPPSWQAGEPGGGTPAVCLAQLRGGGRAEWGVGTVAANPSGSRELGRGEWSEPSQVPERDTVWDWGGLGSLFAAKLKNKKMDAKGTMDVRD